MFQANGWTGRVGSGVVGALPDDFDEAMEETQRRAHDLANVEEIEIVPHVLERAYRFLFEAFPDREGRRELMDMSARDIVDYFLDV